MKRKNSTSTPKKQNPRGAAARSVAKKAEKDAAIAAALLMKQNGGEGGDSTPKQSPVSSPEKGEGGNNQVGCQGRWNQSDCIVL